MGNGKEREEVNAMRRSLSLTIIILLIACSITAAPLSFAEKIDKTNFNGRHSDNEYDVSNGSKDTSWFDYENPKDSYKISTEEQLIGLSSLINEEQTDKWKPTRLERFEGVTFTLTRDIELTEPWIPIGIDDSAYFAGTFNGNGHTISGMKINKTLGNTGFFGYLKGEVKNLTIEGVNNSNDSNSGGIAGTLDPIGKIVSCTSNVNVKGKDKTGGIVGNNEGGTIESCINNGSVSGTYKVGGIVGENWNGLINECGNRGEIKSTKRGVATYGTGGVAGRSVSAEAELKECYNTGTISSNTESTGGVVGYLNASGSTVRDCFNIGTININIKSSDKELSEAYVGGVAGTVGINGVVIKNTYNAGIINNADVYGGVIGRYLNDTDYEVNEKFIKNNYYVTKAAVAGIGFIEMPNDEYIENATKGISESSMHNLASSLSVAYTKDTGAYGNNGYPVLRWQEPLTVMDKTYIEGVSKSVQKQLDEYVVKTTGKSNYGDSLISILCPGTVTSNAFILYMEAQEKIEETKESIKENYENE